MPLDSELFQLGLEFVGHIGNTNWKTALGIFIKIEQRTACLLAQMKVEKKHSKKK